MAFTESKLAREGSSGNSSVPRIFTYDGSAGGSNDASAAIAGSGFFDAAAGKLAVGDIIMARNNNVAGGLTILVVLTAGHGATVTTKVITAVTS